MKLTRHNYSVLKQICNLIPRNLVSKLAKKHGVSKQSRAFSPWSHIMTMLYSQIAHSLSLNDISDSLCNHEGIVRTIRMAPHNACFQGQFELDTSSLARAQGVLSAIRFLSHTWIA